jgi:spoIIIJ-associated protein
MPDSVTPPADAGADEPGSTRPAVDGDGEGSLGEATNDPADLPAEPDEAPVEGSSRVAPLGSDLEREGDLAADYLEELLDIADLDGDIDLDVENDRAMVSVVGGDLSSLVGQDGEVLEALQELTRLAVLAGSGERSRLMLDIGGFRAARKAALTEQATKAAEEVRSTGTPMPLAPMTPFERKVVHDAVAAAGLRSESEGIEPLRHVVILPA